MSLLNPDLLGVEDQLPLALDGDTTAVGVDQLFIDDVGRLTFVEFKNERADLSALAQLLSYGMHWSGRPISEIERGFRDATRKRTPEEVLTKSLTGLRSWAKVASPITKRACPWTRWPAAPSAADFARKHWGLAAVAMSGAPTRLVLVAPDFDDGTIKLAKALAARYVAIELVRAELRSDEDGGVYLAWDHVVAPPDDLETTWRIASLLSSSVPDLRARFHANAWADPGSKNSFSFSPTAAPAVRIWIETNESSTSLSTFVPDGWYSDTPKRAALRTKLLGRLPSGHAGDRYLTWNFPATSNSGVVEVMQKIIGAIEEVLVPAAPQD